MPVTHVSARHQHFPENNRVLCSWLCAQKADLFVHTSDLGMDSAGTLEDLHLAAEWILGFAAESVCVPGNYDVGDRVEIMPTQPVNNARLTKWRDLIGPDDWSRDQGVIEAGDILLHHLEEALAFLLGVADAKDAPLAYHPCGGAPCCFVAALDFAAPVATGHAAIRAPPEFTGSAPAFPSSPGEA